MFKCLVSFALCSIYEQKKDALHTFYWNIEVFFVASIFLLRNVTFLRSIGL